MTFVRMGRAAGLGFFAVFCVVAAAFAHALPGSILLLSQEDGQLRLSISLPVEDLVLAAPVLNALEAEPADQNMAADSLTALADYFAEHLAIRQSSRELQLKLVQASLQSAENEHVGKYDLLVVQLEAELPAARTVFPLTLIYDAVMHEVRNHRAVVFWTEPGAEPRGIAEFGFQAAGDAPRPVLLMQP